MDPIRQKFNHVKFDDLDIYVLKYHNKNYREIAKRINRTLGSVQQRVGFLIENGYLVRKSKLVLELTDKGRQVLIDERLQVE
jgi:predicted transcriptional regulator